ncbi:MAG: DUF1611 domain-containing protein [Clostridia bacterium]|nr:DUF1611 domain-containing protein [Clostridia bacterium]
MKNAKKAVLYPFNKITRGLIRFKDLANIDIVKVIDFTFNIGEDAGIQVDGNHSGIKIVDSIEKGLEDVDVLVLNDPGTAMDFFMDFYKSHKLDEKWRELVRAAHRKGIEIISTNVMDDEIINAWLAENNIRIKTYAKTREEILNFINNSEQIHAENNAKLVTIFATRACYGKFTAQMNLLRELLKQGKKAKAVITEPTHFLFNQADGDILALTNRAPLEIPEYLLSLKKNIESDGYDYILIASQSTLLSRDKIHVIWNTSLMKHFRTNYFILVVGYDDDEKIKDCMDILRIYGDCDKPFALLLPDKIEVKYCEYESIPEFSIEKRKKELKDKFKVDVVETVKDINKICSLL